MRRIREFNIEDFNNEISLSDASKLLESLFNCIIDKSNTTKTKLVFKNLNAEELVYVGSCYEILKKFYPTFKELNNVYTLGYLGDYETQKENNSKIIFYTIILFLISFLSYYAFGNDTQILVAFLIATILMVVLFCAYKLFKIYTVYEFNFLDVEYAQLSSFKDFKEVLQKYYNGRVLCFLYSIEDLYYL